MAVRNRKDLADFFTNGSRPSQSDFQDLIESSVNILDDGFAKTKEDGLKLAPKDENNRLISFLKKSGDAIPLWTITMNDEEDLIISRGKEDHVQHPPSLILRKDGNIELNAQNTTITGTRKGNRVDPDKFAPKADGKWHDITEALYGIHVLEVIATCGEENTGQHAVLMAWATQCYGDRCRIKSIGSYYNFFGHKIKLRWLRRGTKCTLQVKTRLSYGKDRDLDIQCHIAYLHNWNKQH